MKKIILLLFIILFSTSSLALVDKRIDTPENRKLLKKIETAYNQMHSLKAEFAQFNSKMKEDLQTGTIYIKRPGQMRLVYEKGSPLEFVAEVYAGILEGNVYSDDIMRLYKKYLGPPLPSK